MNTALRHDIWRSVLFAVVFCCLSLLMASTGFADTNASDWRLAVGYATGAVGLDPSLTNYKWDVQPSFQWSGQATLYHGPFAAGLRLSRAGTTQATGIPGETVVPKVTLTTFDVIGQYRLASYRRVEFWGSAQGGNMHLGYDPDEFTFDPGGVSGPITVNYDPITEWAFGMGMEVRSELTTQLALALQAETTTFALDTSYRSGSEIVETRERFYNWHLRLQLSWLLGLG